MFRCQHSTIAVRGLGSQSDPLLVATVAQARISDGCAVHPANSSSDVCSDVPAREPWYSIEGLDVFLINRIDGGTPKSVVDPRVARWVRTILIFLPCSEIVKLIISWDGADGDVSIPVNATATATPGAQSKTSVCIPLVNALDSPALLVNSGAQITAPNCEIDVLSTQSPAATFNTTLNVENICIKGSTILKNGGASPPVQTGCAAISDPFAGTLPSVSVGACNFTNQVYNPGTVTLNPGVYCGSTNFNGSGTLTLNPGLYVIKSGAMIFNSGWTVTGTGVTFYLVDQNATITFNGGVNANLSAPTSGTYANILMFEPAGLSNSQLPINGSSGDSFAGLIYLPSRDVTINQVSNATANSVTMVLSTLILDQMNWSITPGTLSMSRATGNAASAYLSK
jgi:hypothetical protein